MASTRAAKKGGLFSTAKWWALGGLGAAIVVGQLTGYLGFAIGELKAQVFPRDNGLLEHVPDTERAVVIIDPHRVDVMSLGGPRGFVGRNVSRVREDVKHLTGVDLFVDVDKIVLTSQLVVAKGRFDLDSIGKKLAEARYTKVEHKGQSILVRQGEDALSVVGDTLLYGDEAAIKASLDAQAEKHTLYESEKVKERLSAMGWDRPLLATVQLVDERPSIRQAVAGSTGPRSYTIGITTKNGMDVSVLVEAASPGAAEETAKLLDEQRKSASPLPKVVSPDLSRRLSDVAKTAQIAAEPGTSNVRIKMRLDQPTLDAIGEAAGKAITPEMGRGLRLLQLLTP